MRRAGAGLIVAVLLALAGCKSTDKDDKTPGGSVGKGKDNKFKDKDQDKNPAPGKGGTWLDDVGKLPGAGTGIPKGTGLGPKDPGFDPKTAAQDALGGRVLDPDGRPARNIFIRIDKAGAAAPDAGAGLGIYTKPDGYFSASGFVPGQTYELTAEATTQDGRKLRGVMQTKVPNPIITILLRDDLAPGGGAFPPEPKPTDTTPPKDGGWGPGGPATGVPPTTIGGGAPKPPAGTGAIPPPADIGFPPPPAGVPEKPENLAEKKDPFKPPPANIPNPYAPPPVPPLPPLPPVFGPPPGGRSSGTGTTTGNGASAKLALVDTLDRPWGLDAVKPGSLVLLEFATSTCKHCPAVLPVLKEMQSRYGASGLQVVGVMCDNVPQKERLALAAKYQSDHNLNYALFVEPGAAGTVRDQYGVEGYPHAVLLNSAGKVLWRGHPGQKPELESAIKQNLTK